MRARRLVRSLLAVSSLLVASSSVGCGAEDGSSESSVAAVSVARPTQFVILAFDGSLNNDFWAESRSFASAADVKFTYFVNSVYFVPNANKSIYRAPHGLGAGKSAIGFGGDSNEKIRVRYDHVQAARSEGHEIGSHANGHFDGSNWSESDWDSEFDQWNTLLFQNPNVTPRLSFGPSDSIGFRAPQLGHSAGLFPVLASHGYEYDTSKTAAADFWPRKGASGVWNFPLAQLRIVGSGRGTLSMDYNFYMADSKAEPNPSGKETFKKQMIDTYGKYFEANYFGNRAPLHIGHHFSKWNGGAYWEAMQVFAKKVCHLPEVKCGTYKELLAFVKSNEANIPAYQAGSFTKMPQPPSSEPVEVSAPFSDAELAAVLSARESHDDEADE